MKRLELRCLGTMDLNPVFVYEEGKGVDIADAVIIKREKD